MEKSFVSSPGGSLSSLVAVPPAGVLTEFVESSMDAMFYRSRDQQVIIFYYCVNCLLFIIKILFLSFIFHKHEI